MSKKAISTYGTHLMIKGPAEWEMLVEIKDYPDLEDKPNMISVQTLSDESEPQIPGTKKASEKTFTANYTKESYERVKSFANKEVDIAVWFGVNDQKKPSGEDGKFAGKGFITVSISGGSIDNPVEMKISIAMIKPFEIDKTV